MDHDHFTAPRNSLRADYTVVTFNKWALVVALGCTGLSTGCASEGLISAPPATAVANPSTWTLLEAASVTDELMGVGTFETTRVRATGESTRYSGAFNFTTGQFEVISEDANGTGTLRLIDGVAYLSPASGSNLEPGRWYVTDGEITLTLLLGEALGYADWLELARGAIGTVTAVGTGVDGTVRYRADVDPRALLAVGGSPIVALLSTAPDIFPAEFDLDGRGMVRRIATADFVDLPNGPARFETIFTPQFDTPLLEAPLGAIPVPTAPVVDTPVEPTPETTPDVGES